MSGCNASCGGLTYDWNFDGIITTNGGIALGNTYFTPGTHTVNVTANFGSYTVAITPYIISVLPSPTGSITATASNLCGQGLESFTYAPGMAGTYTYTWSSVDIGTSSPSGTITSGQGTGAISVNFAGITNPVRVSVVVTNSLGCSSTISYTVAKCCATASVSTTYPSNYTFTTSTVLTGGQHIFTGTVSVNTGVNIQLDQAEIIMKPAARMVVKGTGNLLISKSYMHGCQTQWDGVYADAGSTVRFDGDIVEDAQRVIVDSLGAAYIEAAKTIFNKNYKGIVLKASVTTNTIFLTQNAFTSSNLNLSTAVSYSIPVLNPGSTVNAGGTYTSLPKANLIAPYSTISGVSGIECSNTQSVSSSYIRLGQAITSATVGNVNQNLFDKLTRGIYIDNSKVQVVNCYFQYHKTVSTTGAGVSVNGSTLTTGNLADTKVGVGANEQSYFDNNDIGVYSNNPTPLVVQKATFTNNDIAVSAIANSKGKTVTVITNTCTNNRLGVFMAFNSNINCTVQGNVFSNTSALGTYANNYGIYMAEISTPTTAIYNVIANTATGYYNGIYSSSTYSTYINGNTINLRADNTGGSNIQCGIQAANCNTPKISTNSVSITSGTSTLTTQRGIGTDVCTLPSVVCNSVTGVSVHIKAYGACLTSTAGSGYVGNIMNTYNYGFWLDGNGEIGDQFYLSTTRKSADNQWSGGITGSLRTIVTNTSNTTYTPTPKFYTRSTPSQYSIPATETSPYPICTGPDGCPLAGTNTVNVSSVCSSGGSGGGGGSGFAAGGGGSGELMQYAEEIAAQNIDNSNSTGYMYQRQLYQNIKLQDVDISGNSSLAGFMQNTAITGIGKFFTADSLMNAGQWGSAVSLGNAVGPKNNIEQNQADFNTIYAYYLDHDHSLGKGHVTALEKIAELCPMEDGPAVYSARTLLFPYTGKKYINSCENGENVDGPNTRLFGSPVRNLKTDEEIRVANSIRVYPNPSSNELFVEGNACVNCEFVLYNVMGQVILKQVLDGTAKLDVRFLNNGSYFYKITNSQLTVKSGKLIINH